MFLFLVAALHFLYPVLLTKQEKINHTQPLYLSRDPVMDYNDNYNHNNICLRPVRTTQLSQLVIEDANRRRIVKKFALVGD